jgi:hypothetical protein
MQNRAPLINLEIMYTQQFKTGNTHVVNVMQKKKYEGLAEHCGYNIVSEKSKKADKCV